MGNLIYLREEHERKVVRRSEQHVLRTDGETDLNQKRFELSRILDL